ncbi:MAG TPA: phosphate starvation-inducible protein PhoH [Ruminococcus sp.]|nr:phosphate starvation-inducible protein PhoH [Ruminococcus sp.]
MAERIWEAANTDEIAAVFGSYDVNVNMLQKQFHVVIVNRGTGVKITGSEEQIEKAVQALDVLLQNVRRGNGLNDQTVRYVATMVADNAAEEVKALTADAVSVTVTGKAVRPRTVGQKRYLEAIGSNTIVLGIGPAGTGKTYLAVAMAVKALKAHDISRIILTRPAVEAGEKLGFLPGDLQDKVDPYLRPLYDALFEMLGAETVERDLEKNIIEIAPLAYMRGRTLDNAFIILDEAQNTTSEQIKMFLTRLGEGSKMVITGDITQIDLPDPHRSGLIEAMKVLGDVEDIVIHQFSEKDVVRHKLVQDIITAYANYEHKHTQNTHERKKNRNG